MISESNLYTHQAVFCSIQGALRARAWLIGEHQRGRVQAALLIAPTDYGCLFEMEPYTKSFQPMPAELMPSIPLGYLAKRRASLTLAKLQRQLSAPSASPQPVVTFMDEVFRGTVEPLLEGKQLALPSMVEPADPPLDDMPPLYAGPSALARPTHHQRRAPTNALNVLVCMSAEPSDTLFGRMESLMAQLDTYQAQADKLGLTLVYRTLLWGELPRLALRELGDKGFACELASIPTLFGALGYANQVITDSPECWQLATAMHRSVS